MRNLIKNFLFALLLLPGLASAQQLINCSTGVPCDPTTGPAQTGTGDSFWKSFGKVNANFNTLGPIFVNPSTTQLSMGPLRINPGTIVWSGAGSGPAGFSGLWDYANYTGTCTSNCWANTFGVVNWAVNNTSPNAGYGVNLINVIGSTETNNYIGMNLDVQVNTVPAGAGASSKIFQGASWAAHSNVNMGGSGSGLSAYGSLFANGTYCFLQSGATNWNSCVGQENDLAINTGASANNIIGYSTVLLATNAVAPVQEGIGFGVSAASGASPTITTAFAIGDWQGFNAMASTSTIVGYQPHTGNSAGPTIACGSDFGGLCNGGFPVTFTTAAYSSSGYKVDPLGNVAVNSLGISTAGAVSAASWTTNGVGLSGTNQIFTDTTGSGTITTEGVYALPAPTIATTNAGVTITNLANLYVPAPIAGTNVTATNLWSVQAAGGIKTQGFLLSGAGATFGGGIVNINGNSNNATNIGTGTTTSAVNIANGTGNNAVNIGNGTGKVSVAGPLQSTAGTRFSVASGTGACATSSTLVGGVQAGNLTCTGSTGASTVTLTLVAATTAYTCWGRDITTPTVVTQTGAVSTTGVTLTLTSVTANDVVQFGCLGY